MDRLSRGTGGMMRYSEILGHTTGNQLRSRASIFFPFFFSFFSPTIIIVVTFWALNDWHGYGGYGKGKGGSFWGVHIVHLAGSIREDSVRHVRGMVSMGYRIVTFRL